MARGKKLFRSPWEESSKGVALQTEKATLDLVAREEGLSPMTLTAGRVCIKNITTKASDTPVPDLLRGVCLKKWLDQTSKSCQDSLYSIH